MHIVKDSIADPDQLYLGSTKDIRGMTEYFEDRNIPFDEISAKGRSDMQLLKQLRGMNLDKYTMALFEYPRYPASLLFLRRHFPDMKLLVRSHNAEFYHQLHIILARTMITNGKPAET